MNFIGPLVLTVAETDGVVTALQGITNDMFGVAKSIALVIMAAVIVINAIKLIVASEQQEVAKAKSWLFRAVVGFLAVFFAPYILDTIKSIASSAGVGDFNW